MMTPATGIDSRVRMMAFDFLREQRSIHGDVIPQRVLQAGFQFDGRRVPLMNPQGIFKPAVIPTYPLSFRTSPPSMRHAAPYEDEL
ncbi:MAG: HNH endonuclease, partial [Kiritimatiellia bacterium]|nr:HNH endonuclease [Kiritimatiellia bacterium]